jgi:hypothetical protein
MTAGPGSKTAGATDRDAANPTLSAISRDPMEGLEYIFAIDCGNALVDARSIAPAEAVGVERIVRR